MGSKPVKFDKFYENQTDNSRIKANIVAEYFPQYARILLKKPQNTIRYLDLFAGPGKYGDDNLSTPMLITNSCIEDSILKEKVQLLFNDMYYISDLEKNIRENFNLKEFNFQPRFGAREIGVDPLIDGYLRKVFTNKKNPYPTLLYFDPFGYKAINTLTLGEFMKNWGNEIFLFFNSKRINAAIENKKFDHLMKELFPLNYDTIKNDTRYGKNVNERLKLIRANIENEFRAIVKGKLFMSSFRFMEEDNSATSHFVLHITKHPKGYELVKQIFHEYDNIGAPLDNYGTYTFDGKRQLNDSNNLDFGDPNIDALSDKLRKDYAGKTITAGALFKEHHTKTVYSSKHYVLSLRKLVENDEITSEYMDGKSHRMSVILINECILKFK